MVVITKIDMSPIHVLAKTKEVLIELFSQKVKGRNIIWMNEINNSASNQVEDVDNRNLMRNIPIFCVSNKTGESIDLLRNFIFQLPIRKINQINGDLVNEDVMFSIDAYFYVRGVGTVLSGKLLKGRILKNDRLLLGPLNGMFYPVTARSFHDNFRNSIEGLECGMSGCVSIKPLNKQIDFKKIKNRKGSYLITPPPGTISMKDILTKDDINQTVYYEFEADVIVVGKHSTQITVNYQPVINCKKIVQTARVLNIENKEYIRPGEMSKIRFRFIYRPEFLQVNDRFIFREGTTRGVGIIRRLIDTDGYDGYKRKAVKKN